MNKSDEVKMSEDVNTKLKDFGLSNAIISQLCKKENSTFMDSLEETHERVRKEAEEACKVKDSYGNRLLAIGNNDKVEQFTNNWFTNDTLNYLLWLSLYNDSWVFRRAIDKPAQDEIRCGITIQGEFEPKKQILRDLRKQNASLIQLVQWGGLFGGSIAVMMFDGYEDADYAKSADWDKIRKSKIMRLYVTDRWYGCAPTYDDTVDDMLSLDYGKPKFYDVTFANGHSFKVHHDYILRYEHRFAPPLIKNGQLQGWGYAEGSHILGELSKDDKLRTSIQSLIDKCLIEVIKMSGMRGLFMGSDEQSTEQIEKRLEMVNWARNFNSLTFLDKEDEYEMNSFSGLTGLADLLEQNMLLISSALEMQGILYGPLEKGFSNDPDAMRRYSDTINGRCENYIRPIMEKLLWMLYNKYNVQEKVDFEFNLLNKEDEEDKHTKSINDICDVLSKMLTDGVIDTTIYAKAIKQYMEKGILSLDMDDKYIESLEQKSKEESEDFDLGN